MKLTFLLVFATLSFNTFAYDKFGCESIADKMSFWKFINEDDLQIDSAPSIAFIEGPQFFGEHVFYVTTATDKALRIRSTYEVKLLLQGESCKYVYAKRLKHERY